MFNYKKATFVCFIIILALTYFLFIKSNFIVESNEPLNLYVNDSYFPYSTNTKIISKFGIFNLTANSPNHRSYHKKIIYFPFFTRRIKLKSLPKISQLNSTIDFSENNQSEAIVVNNLSLYKIKNSDDLKKINEGVGPNISHLVDNYASEPFNFKLSNKYLAFNIFSEFPQATLGIYNFQKQLPENTTFVNDIFSLDKDNLYLNEDNQLFKYDLLKQNKKRIFNIEGKVSGIESNQDYILVYDKDKLVIAQNNIKKTFNLKIKTVKKCISEKSGFFLTTEKQSYILDGFKLKKTNYDNLFCQNGSRFSIIYRSINKKSVFPKETIVYENKKPITIINNDEPVKNIFLTSDNKLIIFYKEKILIIPRS